jgi:hypothetical protein
VKAAAVEYDFAFGFFDKIAEDSQLTFVEEVVGLSDLLPPLGQLRRELTAEAGLQTVLSAGSVLAVREEVEDQSDAVRDGIFRHVYYFVSVEYPLQF